MRHDEWPRLPKRLGPPPQTHHPTAAKPFHSQLDQIAPIDLQEKLFERAQQLGGIATGPSEISVPGARGLFVEATHQSGPAAAFMSGREFAHVHPAHDGSLHMQLPPGFYEVVLSQGWGEPHPSAKTMLVFGPRSEEELEVVWEILLGSADYARGFRG